LITVYRPLPRPWISWEAIATPEIPSSAFPRAERIRLDVIEQMPETEEVTGLGTGD
jgi:hypothetical protein